jgi:hypothetical protein
MLKGDGMSALRALVIVVVIAAIGGAVWYFWPEPPKLPPPPPEAPRVVPAEPQGPQHPIAEAPQAAPLPTVKESDPAMRDAITGLVGPDAFARYVVPEEILHRIVATIDNLPRKAYAQRLNPVKTPQGQFATTGKDDDLAISPANAARYAPYVAAFDAIPTDKAVEAYVHFYPLFQKAYVDLGYPNGYFNDRLVEVLDDLLATPDVQGPVKLVVPHVLYEYADPDLQSRSAGQKVLLRMGTDNAKKVKAKLSEIRARITKEKP